MYGNGESHSKGGNNATLSGSSIFVSIKGHGEFEAMAIEGGFLTLLGLSAKVQMPAEHIAMVKDMLASRDAVLTAEYNASVDGHIGRMDARMYGKNSSH
jgi:hypothetical protein